VKSLRSLLFLLALPLINQAQTPDLGPLTNQRVILLVENGVRASEVARMIEAAPIVSFNLTPGDTDLLLRAGVSEGTIKLMAGREIGIVYPSDNIRTAPDYMNRREPMIVPDGTRIRLRLTRNLHSADAKTGDTIDFEVLDEVKVDHRLIIERGATAFGTITGAYQNRHLGRGNKLELTLDFVKLANGEAVALRPDVNRYLGKGRVGVMFGAMAATTPVWPVSYPLFLLLNGKDTIIPEGKEVTAYTNGAANLNGLDFDAR
jgi:hypothetical protein